MDVEFNALFQQNNVFKSLYFRSNSSEGDKIICCFPTCSVTHSVDASCGAPVRVKITRVSRGAKKEKVDFSKMIFLGEFKPSQSKHSVSNTVTAGTLRSSLHSMNTPTKSLYLGHLITINSPEPITTSSTTTTWGCEVEFRAESSARGCWQCSWVGSGLKTVEHSFAVTLLVPHSHRLGLLQSNDDALFRPVASFDSPRFGIRYKGSPTGSELDLLTLSTRPTEKQKELREEEEEEESLINPFPHTPSSSSDEDSTGDSADFRASGDSSSDPSEGEAAKQPQRPRVTFATDVEGSLGEEKRRLRRASLLLHRHLHLPDIYLDNSRLCALLREMQDEIQEECRKRQGEQGTGGRGPGAPRQSALERVLDFLCTDAAHRGAPSRVLNNINEVSRGGGASSLGGKRKRAVRVNQQRKTCLKGEGEEARDSSPSLESRSASPSLDSLSTELPRKTRRRHRVWWSKDGIVQHTAGTGSEEHQRDHRKGNKATGVKEGIRLKVTTAEMKTKQRGGQQGGGGGAVEAFDAVMQDCPAESLLLVHNYLANTNTINSDTDITPQTSNDTPPSENPSALVRALEFLRGLGLEGDLSGGSGQGNHMKIESTNKLNTHPSQQASLLRSHALLTVTGSTVFPVSQEHLLPTLIKGPPHIQSLPQISALSGGGQQGVPDKEWLGAPLLEKTLTPVSTETVPFSVFAHTEEGLVDGSDSQSKITPFVAETAAHETIASCKDTGVETSGESSARRENEERSTEPTTTTITPMWQSVGLSSQLAYSLKQVQALRNTAAKSLSRPLPVPRPAAKGDKSEKGLPGPHPTPPCWLVPKRVDTVPKSEILGGATVRIASSRNYSSSSGAADGGSAVMGGSGAKVPGGLSVGRVLEIVNSGVGSEAVENCGCLALLTLIADQLYLSSSSLH